MLNLKKEKLPATTTTTEKYRSPRMKINKYYCYFVRFVFIFHPLIFPFCSSEYSPVVSLVGTIWNPGMEWMSVEPNQIDCNLIDVIYANLFLHEIIGCFNYYLAVNAVLRVFMAALQCCVNKIIMRWNRVVFELKENNSAWSYITRQNHRNFFVLKYSKKVKWCWMI